MSKDPPDAIFIVADGLTIANHDVIFRYAVAHHVPDMEEYAFSRTSAASLPMGQMRRTNSTAQPTWRIESCTALSRPICLSSCRRVIISP